MNLKVYAMLTLLLASFIFCKQQSTSQPEYAQDPILTPAPETVPGMVVAEFVTTITHAQAEQFIAGLNLVALDMSDFDRDDVMHLGLIGIPVGQEKAWVDSLKTFPSFVLGADFVYVIHAL